MRLRDLLTLALLPVFVAAAATAADTDRDGNPYLGGVADPPEVHAPEASGGTTYDNPTDFLAATGPLTLEDFEDEALLGNCDAGGVTVLNVSDFLVNCDEAALKILDAECFDFGNHNTTPGGERFLNVDTDIANVTGDLMLVFPAVIQAVGLYVTDLDSAGVTMTINGQAYPIVPPSGHGNGGEDYLGVVDMTGFTTVMLTVDGIDSHWALDDVSWGSLGPVSVDDASWGAVKSGYR